DPLMQQTEAAIPEETAALNAVRELTTVVERAELYEFAQRIADASGGQRPRECAALARIAAFLDIAKPAVEKPRAAPSATERHWLPKVRAVVRLMFVLTRASGRVGE